MPPESTSHRPHGEPAMRLVGLFIELTYHASDGNCATAMPRIVGTLRAEKGAGYLICPRDRCPGFSAGERFHPRAIVDKAKEAFADDADIAFVSLVGAPGVAMSRRSRDARARQAAERRRRADRRSRP